MRWWYFDDNLYGTNVFLLKIVNSVSTANDGRRRELTIRLTSRAHAEHDIQGELQDIRYSLPHSLPIPVCKR
jgi:hypothetical protein